MEPTIDGHDTSKRDGWVVVCVTIAMVSMLVAVVAVGIGLSRGSEAVTTTAAGATKTIEVTLGDLYITPAKVSVAAGTAVTFHIRNQGSMAHDFHLDGGGKTKLIQSGGEATLADKTIAKSGEAWCAVAGHKEAGMMMAITVTGSSAPVGTTASGTAAKPAGATIDPQAMPPVDWKPFDPTVKPAPGGTEHKVTMTAEETVREVAPGVKQELWTFNGQTPGPILRGKVGDLFTITLTNHGKMGHSIDFHASKVAWNDEMRTIDPGESLKYQYRAKYAGFFMYHCGTNPALHHIGNGMFGGVIIDPPNLAPVDHEFVLVQSELYLGPDGKPGDLTKMQSEQDDAVVFNGYWNQYKFAPIRVEPKQRIRVWVLDAGPSENSAFHIVGTIFDTVFKEGTLLLQPDARTGGSQVLDLQPAQGGYVEFSFDEAGLYPIVTHKFANAGKGALGLFQAGDVEVPAGAGH